MATEGGLSTEYLGTIRVIRAIRVVLPYLARGRALLDGFLQLGCAKAGLDELFDCLLLP